MKTYSFSVQTDFVNNGKSFIDSIINEIDSEKQQLRITHAINTETTKLHRQILTDLVDEINSILEPIGLKFNDVIETNSGANQYYNHVAMCNINETSRIAIQISAMNDHTFKDSKYCTYTGAYQLSIGKPKHGGILLGDGNSSSFKTIDEALNLMKRDLKEHMLKSRH